MHLSDTGCPICLRGRSAKEITRGYTQAREQDARRRRRPFVILASVAALGIVGYAFQRYQTAILNLGQKSLANFSRLYDENSAPATVAPSQPSPPPPDAPSPPQEASSIPPPVFLPTPTPTTVPDGPPPAVEPRLDAPEPPLPGTAVGQGVLHGRIFDLKTLKPLAGARLTIKRGDSAFAFAASGPDGWYSVLLPRLEDDSDGYQLAAQQADYTSSAQYEGDIPYLKLSASEREHLIQVAQDGDTHPSPLNIASDYVRRDVFLSPRR